MSSQMKCSVDICCNTLVPFPQVKEAKFPKNMISFISHSRKCNPIYTDRNHSGWGGSGLGWVLREQSQT